MNQVNQNINKGMNDSDLIDIDSLDFSDDQTWLSVIPNDSGQKVDIVDWNVSCDWPFTEDNDYIKEENVFFALLDNILNNQPLALPDKHKFDSRTYVRPKKRVQRPSIQSIVEVANPPSLSPNSSLSQPSNKYMTYNKHNNPMGLSPMLRLKTFSVELNTDNSSAVKDYAMKRKSLVQDDDLQQQDITLVSDVSDRLSYEHVPSKPINIDLSQPAHNLHSTFNKGITNIMNERPSLNMYCSGESLARMSPPSLVSSLMMESTGTLRQQDYPPRPSNDRNSLGIPAPESESIDNMMTSMTLSILDEKDMSTSFLSQTTYPEHDSLMDSLPPSLVSSVNSSYIVSNTSRLKDSMDSKDTNIFSSATFTRLEQSEKLLSARPRCQMYNSFTKRDSMLKNSESYTKSREEASQIDSNKILNENKDKSIPKMDNDLTETITLHYSNIKFKHDNDAEKENHNSTFETDDAFFNDMGMQKVIALSNKASLDVTLDQKELNEIIQARQKLSLARKALPVENERFSNKSDITPPKSIQLPNQTITMPRQCMENASELLSKRRSINNGFNKTVTKEETISRETPKRNATFKKTSPKQTAMDTTVVYIKDDNQIIDINSATMNLIDSGEKILRHGEWGSQERAMAGSSESTDTGTFSSSSPPDSAPENGHHQMHSRAQIASTPLMSLKKGMKPDMLDLHATISPIYDMVNDKSYTVTKTASNDMESTFTAHNQTVINSATMIKKSSAKRDILAGRCSPDKKIPSPTKTSPRIISAVPYASMAPPPTAVPRRTGLPTSKLRQYSSHKELSRIPAGNPNPPALNRAPTRTIMRRGVYASNPVLSPTSSNAPSYDREDTKPVVTKPSVVPPVPPLVRQGTETLRRERPVSQLVAPKDHRAVNNAGLSSVPAPMRNYHGPPPLTRPYSIAGASQLKITRPASVPVQRPYAAPVIQNEPPRPSSGVEQKMSGLPRPSRLPAPRRALRPPSVYSVAPAADIDHY